MEVAYWLLVQILNSLYLSLSSLLRVNVFEFKSELIMSLFIDFPTYLR